MATAPFCHVGSGRLCRVSRSLNPLDRRILALAVPALGALIAEPVFVLVDSAMVGHLGTAELGEVGHGLDVGAEHGMA